MDCLPIKIISVSLLLIAAAFAQERPAIQLNTISVTAQGTFEAAPDTAEVRFNISAQENDAKSAYARASKAADQVRELLRSNGIDPHAAQFGYFALDPVYDFKTAKRKLVAYRVNSAVMLKLKDFSKVGAILEAISGLDATESQSLNYVLEDTEAAKIKAVSSAYAKARSEAEAVAQAGGRTLGQVMYASVDTAEPSRPITMQARAAVVGAMATPAPSEGFAPQTVTVTADVTVLFALK